MGEGGFNPRQASFTATLNIDTIADPRLAVIDSKVVHPKNPLVFVFYYR